MEKIFITGANRGIGLAVTDALLARGDVHVFGACRHPEKADALKKLQRTYTDALTLVTFDATDLSTLEDMIQMIRQHSDHLDVVINNAGIDPDGQSFAAITAQTMLDVYQVNTVAPLMVSRAVVPLLVRSKYPRLVHISSEMASLTMRDYGGNYAYCSSKAALNMAMRGMAVDLKKQGIITIALDPGWVRTDMGGKSASLSPQESADGIITVIDRLKRDDNGRYLAYDGTEHPW